MLRNLTRFLVLLSITLTSSAVPAGEAKPVICDQNINETIDALVSQHGEAARDLATTGVRQVAAYWRLEDGLELAFHAFCLGYFVPGQPEREALLRRLDGNLEALRGHRVALRRHLREPTDLDRGDRLPVDSLFAGLDPFDHLSDDLFTSRIAFVILLNYPQIPLARLVQEGAGMDRRAWAEARLAKAMSLRIPGEVLQAETRAFSRADEYISSYNIRMDRVVTEAGERPFPEGLRLISHWGLRDELKALYSDPLGNLPKQDMILQVMERIIRQEIPAAAIDNADLDWAPVSNRVAPHVAGAVADWEHFGPADREADRRYTELLKIFHAERAVDPYSPAWPTFIDRRFDADREIPEERVRELLTAVVSAPVARDVAAEIRRRLGRDLRPYDIWYDGFKNRAAVSEDELTRTVQARYPDTAAFDAGIAALLGKLGFSVETAAFLASKIVVDPARGAGHAMGAGMRSDCAHLRTRVPPGGMDYKGYNIAIHELGHNVEQVLSLNRIDWVLLQGVPNTAFTEAFAFLFQARDMDLLGSDDGDRDLKGDANRTIDRFWSTMEIASVGLVDMGVWRWMYAHPDATPAGLREAVIGIAVDVWNRYWAPVIGVKDSPILAIYSHMIDAGLYLPDYSIGFLVQHQVEQSMEGKILGTEMERMVTQGALTPDAWMQGAVGAPLSAQPLLDSVREALKVVR
ncbi:MAG: hypothetical protein ABIK09_04470 [Pseudomonadota bacterium]